MLPAANIYYPSCVVLCCSPESLTEARIRQGLTSPLWFYATLRIAGLDLDIRRPSHNNHSLTLKYHHSTIQLLNQKLASREITDDVILTAMTLMASENSAPIASNTFGGFRPVLTSLQHLDVFGQFRYLEMHRSGLRELIDIRGGIDELTTIGVAEAVQV
jgi:hypothetical protein